MVDRIESRRVLVPPTYGFGSITFTDLNFRPGIVRAVAIVVPRGVRGTVGVGLGYGGVIVIPNTDGELIYTDDEVLEWPVDGLPVGVQWQLVTDPGSSVEHQFHVRMSVDEIAARGTLTAAPSQAEQVMALAPAEPLSVDDTAADEATLTDLTADTTTADGTPPSPADLTPDETGAP